MLSSFKPDELNNLYTNSKKYAASTLHKHKWVTPMYEGYCEYVKQDNMWPIQALTAGNFITYLGTKVCLAESSLSDVVIASLKRINYEKTGKLNYFI
jgi:hypothetical protein